MNSLKKTLLTSTFLLLTIVPSLSVSAATTATPGTPSIAQPPEPPLDLETEDPTFYKLRACWLKSTSPTGSDIRLGDGSHWRIEPGYESEVLTWLPGDALILSPNYMPFTSHNYWFKNLRTGTYAGIDIIMEPIDMGLHSHRVCGREPDGSVIFLQNRVGFEIDRRDRWLVEEWDLNDHIVIGASNAWFGSYEFILMNVNLCHYVRAKLHK